MICKSCQTYYVRDPCPNCGHDSSKKDSRLRNDSSEPSVRPSQIRQRENNSGSQVLVQKEDEDEKLVKPSERFKKERQRNQQEEEHLVKPSERIKKELDDDDIPSFKRFENSQVDVRKPTPIQKKKKPEIDEDIPSFARYQPDDEVDVKNLSKINKPEQQERLKNDKAYRNKVKETLEEVMGLLEKLVEDE